MNIAAIESEETQEATNRSAGAYLETNRSGEAYLETNRSEELLGEGAHVATNRSM